MQISCFTPTHDARYLSAAYTSLLRQNYKDWEWVIVPNNGVTEIHEEIRADPRVRIVSGRERLVHVGALKRAAVDMASGDVFLELDHDDMLMPGDTLQRVASAAKDGADFMYSDVAAFRYREAMSSQMESDPVYRPFTYAPEHGWQTYPVRVYGHNLLATRCFDLTPRSLCEIYYCPDHLRAWSRKAYYEAGGHNPALEVCDDHELMIKTYTNAKKFVHVGGCRYLYRVFRHNTVKYRNSQIQETTRRLKREYLQSLIHAWSEHHNHAVLDVSALRSQGWKKEKHLLQGFGEETIGHITAYDELQKWTGEEVREFMNMAYRALVPGGYLTITVPNAKNTYAFSDVEWKSFFAETSMFPYTQQQRARQNGNVRCRYQQVDCVEFYTSEWHQKHGYGYLRFELCALKGQRQPGLQLI